MLGSAFEGKNPISRRTSNNRSCQWTKLDLSPYNACVHDESVAASFSELWSHDAVHFLLCVGLKVRTANISCPKIQLVQFRKEGKDTEFRVGDTTLEYTEIDRSVCKMSSCDNNRWLCII